MRTERSCRAFAIALTVTFHLQVRCTPTSSESPIKLSSQSSSPARLFVSLTQHVAAWDPEHLQAHLKVNEFRLSHPHKQLPPYLTQSPQCGFWKIVLLIHFGITLKMHLNATNTLALALALALPRPPKSTEKFTWIWNWDIFRDPVK